MEKKFNLKSFRKKAFYEGARGYWQAETRAKQVCYKCKADEGKTPQEAWDECDKEYNEADDKNAWVVAYSNFPSEEDRLSAKTPAAQEIIGEKDGKEK